ncbi:MAG: insulinase family protein [Phycisphaerae bacterium]|nr:insulinase family protein [Phycisphaerae bacterium]
MDFKHTTLDNGLTIVAEVNPDAASMAAGFFVRTGSRDETPEVAGVSHFLEHMVFKGTERRTALDVNREFDEMGADYNAGTSYENTIFYGAVLPEFQQRLLDLLGDILRPSLRQEDFDVEKNVIQEEIALYEDQPVFRTYEKLMAAFFDGHPLGNEILGTTESIGALRREQMLEYFTRRYAPGNVTLVGVGDVDFGALVDQAQHICGDWSPAETQRDTPPAPGKTGRTILADERLVREHVGLMSPAPSHQDDERFAAMLLATVLGDETGSRLYYALVDPAIADEATTAYMPLDAAGAFVTFLAGDPQRADEALEITERELKRFADEGPTDPELTAAKHKLACQTTLSGELPMGRLAAVGSDWVYRGDYMPLSEHVERVYAVTGEQVRELAQRYDLTATCTLALGPREDL